MVKKALSLSLALMLLCLCAPALADGPVLIGLTSTAGSSAKMLPTVFDPYQYSYILTVDASVGQVAFTPRAAWGSTITVNGSYVSSGAQTRYFALTDHPLMVTFRVTSGSASTDYTVFVQRRPSEKRTRVSAGYISSIYQSGNDWYLAADLVTVNYRSSSYADGNRSSYTNDSSYLYRYKLHPNCVFYTVQYGLTRQCKDVYSFMSVYSKAPSMYRIVYMNDQIVAVMPYTASY